MEKITAFDVSNLKLIKVENKREKEIKDEIINIFLSIEKLKENK